MSAASDATEGTWRSILTWRAHDGLRMESTRVQLSGNRIKASGSIVAAKSDTHPAFSASYDPGTDAAGVTLAERDRQLSVARDEENMWLITDHQGQSRGTYAGALDVDVIFSPFFNALPIRRSGLHRTVGTVTLPVVYVTLPELTVNPVSIRYDSHGPAKGIELTSPVAQTEIFVDQHGLILDYPGLAERI